MALFCAGPGCLSNSGAPSEPAKPVQAGADARIKFKDEYKQVIGKDGKLLVNPTDSRKRPPSIPNR
jgi:hypothetical protein